MISQDVITKIRSSTCAIVYAPIRHEEAFAGVATGSKAPPFETTIVGTGFLVHANLVLTNRHVIELITEDHNKVGHHDNWYIRFTYPRSQGGIAETAKRIINIFAWVDPAGVGRHDIGLLQFNRDESTEFAMCEPVEFGELSGIAVGLDVGIYGFPLGNALLFPKPGLQRFGPVVHHGIISAIAPFDVSSPRNITAFLTDVNSAGGMSGSPVFRITDGKVIGIHFAGREGTLGCALPLDSQRVNGWIRFYERIFVQGEKPKFPKITSGGDIVDN